MLRCDWNETQKHLPSLTIRKRRVPTLWSVAVILLVLRRESFQSCGLMDCVMKRSERVVNVTLALASSLILAMCHLSSEQRLDYEGESLGRTRQMNSIATALISAIERETLRIATLLHWETFVSFQQVHGWRTIRQWIGITLWLVPRL